MIGILALVVVVTAPAAGPRWHPVIDWGCRLTPENGETFTLSGQVSKKFDPQNPNIHEREQTALMILSDTSGRFKGKGARGLALRTPERGEYWAVLDAKNGFILNVSENTPDSKATLMDNVAGKSLASGPCETRPSKSLNN